MNANPSSKHEAAKAWVRAGARLHPGILFQGIVGNTMYTCEFSPAEHETWLQDVELGFKDGAEGKWVWDKDLDQFTKMEDTP